MKDLLLGRDSADEVVTLAEQAVSSELQIEAGRYRLEEELRALEVRLGVVDVVGVLEEEGGDAEPSLDLDDGEEGHLALAYGFQALHRLPYLPFALVVVRQPPQPLRYCFHLSLSLSHSAIPDSTISATPTSDSNPGDENRFLVVFHLPTNFTIGSRPTAH